MLNSNYKIKDMRAGPGSTRGFGDPVIMLTERRGVILRAIVGEYISTASPVASDTVARQHGLRVSPATVRNEMVDLEEDGYITRPHTSAGRVPLDKGYRFYADSLPDTIELPVETKQRVRLDLSQAGRDPEACIKMATSILARLAQNMAIITFPKASQPRLRHLELIHLQEFLALLILVLKETTLRQHVIPLKKPMSPEDLTAVANKLNAELVGLSWRQIEAKRPELTQLEEQLVDTTLQIMREEDRLDYSVHYVDGLRHLLSQPEFTESEKLREIVESLEDQSLIHAILDDAPEDEAVKVQIGSENTEEALRPLSMVLCRYGVFGEAAGVLTIIGPTRMAYSKAIGGVKYVSHLLDEMVGEVHGRI